MDGIDWNKFPSPCYIVDEDKLRKNLKILDGVQRRTGCRILLALKGFSMYSVFKTVGEYLFGITASSLNEARLGYEEMGKEVHTYSPAFLESEFLQIMDYSDHIVFNSFNQLDKYRHEILNYNKINTKGKDIQVGIRVNPEYSEIKVPIYDPCYKNSRLGVTRRAFRQDGLEGVSGLHFHTLCEQNSGALARTVPVFEEKFGEFLKDMKWLNLGGGHHITREDYDIKTLEETIVYLKEKYNLEVYLEPGEAIALNSGYLMGSVLDIVNNDMKTAILDVSAACHMPDVIEMPYRPEIIGAKKPGQLLYTYRLGGPSCLAGDIIGDYSFDKPLKPGQRLVFCDMAHYTMVKNNTFNGINLPSIGIYGHEKGGRVLKTFGYEDYKRRL